MIASLVGVLVAISGANCVLLVLILRVVKASHAATESVQINRYQQAVTTPKKNKLPGRPVVEKDSSNDIDLADLDFETGYAALAAYGKGEN